MKAFVYNCLQYIDINTNLTDRSFMEQLMVRLETTVVIKMLVGGLAQWSWDQVQVTLSVCPSTIF